VHDGRQYWSHGGPPFQEQIRVPLLIKPAGHLRDLLSPRVVERWVSLVDLAPTLLDLTGATFDRDRFDGHSLVGGGTTAPQKRRAVFSHGLARARSFGGTPRPALSAVVWRGNRKVFYDVLQRDLRHCFILDSDPEKCELSDQRDQLERAELEEVSRMIRRYHEDRSSGAHTPPSLSVEDEIPARALVTAPRGIILDRIMRVEGLCTRASMEAMIDWARAAPRDGLVVELGTYRGRSAATLCHAVGDGRVVTIDDWSMSTFGGSDEETARNNLAGLGFFPRLLTGPSHHVPHGLAPVAMLVIDSTHEGEVLSGELESWLPQLCPDGVVALHDYERAKFPSLVEVIDEIFCPPEWERLGVVDAMVGFKRALPIPGAAHCP